MLSGKGAVEVRARTLESGFGVSLPFAESLAVRYCRSLEARAMDFRLSKAQQRLQQKCRELAEDFAARVAAEDEVRSIDIQLDSGANALSVFDDARAVDTPSVNGPGA